MLFFCSLLDYLLAYEDSVARISFCYCFIQHWFELNGRGKSKNERDGNNAATHNPRVFGAQKCRNPERKLHGNVSLSGQSHRQPDLHQLIPMVAEVHDRVSYGKKRPESALVDIVQNLVEARGWY